MVDGGGTSGIERGYTFSSLVRSSSPNPDNSSIICRWTEEVWADDQLAGIELEHNVKILIDISSITLILAGNSYSLRNV
jgi:hypothetical protein